MLQRFRLDRPVGLAYLALCLLGCRPRMGPLLPTGLVAATPDQVAGWVSRTAPSEGVLYRFTWLFEDERASKGGRGSARIAPPDTLRFDFAGSLGIGKGSALVVGDSARWTAPERSVEELVPDLPLLWALLGMARLPPPEARLSALESPERVAWRYVMAGDTIDYLHQAGSPASLSAEVRRGGKVVGRSRVTLGAGGAPARARLDMPTVPAKLEITFYATVPTPVFPPATWLPPEP